MTRRGREDPTVRAPGRSKRSAKGRCHYADQNPDVGDQSLSDEEGGSTRAEKRQAKPENPRQVWRRATQLPTPRPSYQRTFFGGQRIRPVHTTPPTPDPDEDTRSTLEGVTG